MGDQQTRTTLLALVSAVKLISKELAASMERDNNTVYEPGLSSRANDIKAISTQMKHLSDELS
jgi:hypothetical protein